MEDFNLGNIYNEITDTDDIYFEKFCHKIAAYSRVKSTIFIWLPNICYYGSFFLFFLLFVFFYC